MNVQTNIGSAQCERRELRSEVHCCCPRAKRTGSEMGDYIFMLVVLIGSLFLTVYVRWDYRRSIRRRRSDSE